MRLDNVRGRARSGGMDLLEREMPPLPPLTETEFGGPTDAANEEMAEFIEFFTGEQRVVTARNTYAPAPLPSRRTTTARQAATPALGRVRSATERVIHAAALRPVVQLPGARSRTHLADAEMDDAEETAAPTTGRRAITLPPVWVLTNLAILAVMLFSFAPQLVSVSAAAACNWYRVRPGDTLSAIGHRYNVSVRSLANANNIADINRIYVAQNLCIPLMPLARSNQPAPAPASQPPIYSAPSNVKAFISYTLPYAREASRSTGWPVSVILAQWGLETGWRTQTYTGFNWGNCGAMPGEPTVGGINKPGSPSAFSYAYSPSQGVQEYVHVAGLGYYTGVAAAARSGGANAAAYALGRSPWDWGHYTNTGNPGSSLISIMRVYNLYWYDNN